MRNVIFALLLACSSLAAAGAPPRRIEIKVSGEGYAPASVKAKPGEKLILVFKAGASTGCCGSLVVPAAKFSGTVEPGKSLEVPVTMPESGKLTFACSMGMCRGEVVPQ
jgi:plastocyanin domain-containing protein